MSTERFETRVAVFVIVKNESGEVLLQQRAPRSYLGGHWDFPSGHGEADEPLRTTAVRELREETGLIARPEDMKLALIDQYFIEVNYLNFVFELRSWQGVPAITEPEKCSAIGWFAEDKLPDACVNVVRMVERAGFPGDLTYTLTDAETFTELMGAPPETLPGLSDKISKE